MIDDIAQVAFSLIGQLVAAGGGGAVVAFALFQFFGKSWIENQLAKDLELAKSEISLLAARKMRLHEREYVIFPEVWSKLNKAVASLGRAVISFREIPDFGRMADLQLDDWVTRSDMTDDEKSFFASEKDKVAAYVRILDWRDLRQARKDFVGFHKYLQSNRIFLSPEIKDKFDHIGSLIHETWITKKLDWDGRGYTSQKDFLKEAYDKLEKQVTPLMREIEHLVQARLFPESIEGTGAGK